MLNTLFLVASILCAPAPQFQPSTYNSYDALGKVHTDCLFPNQFALTFDDGPSPNFPRLLSLLATLQARATFYVNGMNLDAQGQEWLYEAYAQGHEIGSHTYSHAALALLSDQEMKSEMDMNDQAIRSVIAASPRIMRPPYLQTSPHIVEKMVSFFDVARMGVRHCQCQPRHQGFRTRWAPG